MAGNFYNLKPAATKCPCCGQELPDTALTIYPKSGAVIRHGYVVMLGIVRFAVFSTLHKAWPDYVAVDRILSAVSGGRDYAMAPKTLHAHTCALRRMLQPLKCTLASHPHYGYRLVLDPEKRPYKSGRKPRDTGLSAQ